MQSGGGAEAAATRGGGGGGSGGAGFALCGPQVAPIERPPGDPEVAPGAPW